MSDRDATGRPQAGRLLIVDDEDNIVRSLKGVFEDRGHEVLVAGDGETALKRAAADAPDVILLDIWMPGLDGIETLRALKASHPDIQVIMMTGHGTIETAVSATKLGAFDFFEKPLSLPAVVNTVENALAQRRLVLENRRLRMGQHHAHALLGNSEIADGLRERVQQLAGGNDPVAFVGELGVGKRLCGRLLHLASSRRDRPFVVAPIRSDDAAEAGERLFDGPAAAVGRAAGGTLFVDGADRLSRELQERLAAARTVRVVYGTLALDDLEERFAGTPLVRVPPLRERREDVPILARFFLEEFSLEHGRPSRELSDEAVAALSAYAWPSNVNELKNVMERLALSSGRGSDAPVEVSDLPAGIRDSRPAKRPEYSYEEAERLWERRFLSEVLGRHDSDLAAAAEHLHLSEEQLRQKLVALDLIPATTSAGPRQRTLKQSVVLCGQGLHSGLKTGLILSPLPPGSGILFGSISHGDTVPARVDYVDRTGFATGLRSGKAVAKTIEHFMATLHAYGITNLLIKIAEEVPIMDGSARDFCRLLEDGGIVDQPLAAEELTIDRTFQLGDPGDPDGEWMVVEPADSFEVVYDLKYPAPVGHQHFEWRMDGPDDFERDIAPARTFGFLKDIAQLEEMGLASGGRLSNFILIDDEKVVNTELRFPDELVRHKILDITGDFYLLGRKIRGRVRACKTGHADNVAMLKQIQAAYA